MASLLHIFAVKCYNVYIGIRICDERLSPAKLQVERALAPVEPVGPDPSDRQIKR